MARTGVTRLRATNLPPHPSQTPTRLTCPAARPLLRSTRRLLASPWVPLKFSSNLFRLSSSSWNKKQNKKKSKHKKQQNEAERQAGKGGVSKHCRLARCIAFEGHAWMGRGNESRFKLARMMDMYLVVDIHTYIHTRLVFKTTTMLYTCSN